MSVKISLKNIDVTIGLAGGKEPVRDNDGVYTGENVFGNHADAVGPLESARKHRALQVTELGLALEGIANVRNHRDFAA